MAISDAAIRDYLAANANLSDAQIAADMNKYGVSYAQIANVTGVPVADVERRYLGANGASTLPQLGTLGNAVNSMNTPATLTPEIAKNLMQRSMTTGVPTSEFDRYGGYDTVAALYGSNNGTYSLDNFDPAFLDQVDNTIANSGVGNLSVLKITGEPLTKAGRQAMINNGISWTDDDLRSMQIPYEGFLQTPKSTLSSNAGPQLSSGSGLNTSAISNPGREWGTPETVGASNGQLMGAGNANYNSALIRSLRQNSMAPISTNPGVQVTPNAGQTTVNWTPPAGIGSAFNPQVFNPRAATPQEINDYNAYSAYRSSAVGGSSPYMSLVDWINAGRPSQARENSISALFGGSSGGSETGL